MDWPPDQRSMLAEVAAMQLEQPAAMLGFFVAHSLKN
jgi:hypothetical protein